LEKETEKNRPGLLAFIETHSERNDRKTSSPVIREFEIIGEAVGKLPFEAKEKHPDVEWQDIKDFRNLLIHEYFGVDHEIVWKIIQNDLTALLDAVMKIMEETNK